MPDFAVARGDAYIDAGFHAPALRWARLRIDRRPLICQYDFGPIAQLAELPAHNRLVVGSNPAGPTRILALALAGAFFD